MKFIMLSFLALFSNPAEASPLSLDEPREWYSDPKIKSEAFVYDFGALPLEGDARGEKKFWSGDYWPFRHGNINFRWYSPNPVGFNLRSPTKEEALGLNLEALAALAPSEKFDLFLGRYDYPLRREVENKSSHRAKSWEGICHGWAPAAMNHPEPVPRMAINPDGIIIPFGSGDLKALLSYYYAFAYEVEKTHQMGQRCFGGEFLNTSRECSQDLNAGAFHIVLANRIGIERKGFLADLERFKEVWNHPVFAFKSKVVRDRIKPKRSSAKGTEQIVQMKTELFYVTENKSFWEPKLGTPEQLELKKEYEYFLELSRDGRIIGGEWKSKERPDFLWTKEKPRTFEGAFARLSELLED